MRTPESRLERIEQIERKLAQNTRGWTTGELAREFHVDPSTIARDLGVLESMGTGLIKQGRRYILDHRRSLHNIKLSLNELLAIYLAVRLLSRFSDEHNPHVVKALEKLADTLRTKSPLIARHIEQAATAVRARQTRREYVEALEVLTQGWAEGRKVRLRYRSYTKDELTERTFAPYFIEPSFQYPQIGSSPLEVEGVNDNNPSLLLRSIDPEHVGLRFRDIGRHQRFDAILQRLRLDFPLITGREVEGQFWWILTREQRDEILNFSRRNGLKLIEE